MNSNEIMAEIDGGAGAMVRGDRNQARACFLLAAKGLLNLARNSRGAERQACTAKAHRLLVQARSLANAQSPTAVIPSNEAAGANANISASAPTGLTLSDVAGAEEVKRTFKAKFLYPLRHPKQAAVYRQKGSGGVLLYGPPGTGKTFLARALAGELKAPVYAIKPSDIMSKWVGDAEKHIAELFAEARKHPVALIFVDEIDALAPARGQTDGSGVNERVLAQLLAELDGFERHSGKLLFIGATNAPWAMDPALLRPGRFDALAFVGLPDVEARLRILKDFLQSVPLAADVSLDEIAQAAEGCTGAEVHAAAAQAAQAAYYDVIENGGERPISRADLDTALANIHRAATPELMRKFQEFSNHGDH